MIMYMASVCASCTSFKLNSSIVSDPNNKPQWLNEKDFVTEFIQSVKSFDNKHQTKCDQNVELDLGKAHAHKTVLYWATTPSSSVSNSSCRFSGPAKNPLKRFTTSKSLFAEIRF